MYLKHTDPYGNELGLYRSIKEASQRIQTSPQLLSTLFKYKLPLADGSTLTRATSSVPTKQDAQARTKKALAEYSNIGTHYKYLARKYGIDVQDMRRAVLKHDKENRLCSAYAEWLASGGTIQDIADRHDVSSWSLSVRITKGLRS